MPLRPLLAVVGTAIGFTTCLVLLGRVIGFSSPWFVLQAMFCFLGLAKVAEPVFAFSIPPALYAVRPFEGRDGPYRGLGVFGFGELLRRSPFRHLNATVYLRAGRGDLRALYRHASASEATHFWAAVLFAPYIGYLAWSGRWALALLFLAVELLFNVYPILHLRALRGRLDGILGRVRVG
jgi:hypothetical protein